MRSSIRLYFARLDYARLGYAYFTKLRRIIGGFFLSTFADGTHALPILGFIKWYGKQSFVQRITMNALNVQDIFRNLIYITCYLCCLNYICDFCHRLHRRFRFSFRIHQCPARHFASPRKKCSPIHQN